MAKFVPSRLPHFVDPAFLAERSGIELAKIQERISEGITPVTTDGKIAKRDVITLLKAIAREAKSAEKTPAPAAPKKSAEKLNAFQVQERLGQVCDMLAQMIPVRKIRDRLAECWQCPASEAELWIERAYTDLARLGTIGKPARKDQLRDALCTLYEESLSMGDFKSAVTALDRIAKIDGAYAAEKVDVSGAVGMVSSEAVREKIATYLKDPEMMKKIADLTES